MPRRQSAVVRLVVTSSRCTVARETIDTSIINYTYVYAFIAYVYTTFHASIVLNSHWEEEEKKGEKEKKKNGT